MPTEYPALLSLVIVKTKIAVSFQNGFFFFFFISLFILSKMAREHEQFHLEEFGMVSPAGKRQGWIQERMSVCSLKDVQQRFWKKVCFGI